VPPFSSEASRFETLRTAARLAGFEAWLLWGGSHGRFSGWAKKGHTLPWNFVSGQVNWNDVRTRLPPLSVSEEGPSADEK
jgi:hypothetical protein